MVPVHPVATAVTKTTHRHDSGASTLPTESQKPAENILPSDMDFFEPDYPLTSTEGNKGEANSAASTRWDRVWDMEHADEDESPPLDTKLTSDNLKQEKVSKERKGPKTTRRKAREVDYQASALTREVATPVTVLALREG